MGWFVTSLTSLTCMTPWRWAHPPHCDTHHPSPIPPHPPLLSRTIKNASGNGLDARSPALLIQRVKLSRKGTGGGVEIDWGWREEEGWIGGECPSHLLSSSSLRYCRLLLRPQRTLSQLFYLLLLPQQTYHSPVLFLPRPSPAVPLSSSHSFTHSLTLLLFPSATACRALTLSTTDLFTCDPSLPVLVFAILASRMKQHWIISREKMDSEVGTIDRKFTVVQD